MSESLLIQVDEVTKGMLETIEERIFEGTRTAQESGLKDFSDSMDQVQKNLQRSMDSVNKQLKQTNEQIEPLQADIQRVSRLVQEGAIISLERVKEVHDTLQQFMPAMGQQMEQQEQFQQLRSAQQLQAGQNEELLQLCTLLVTKMEALEAEVEWLRQPIWKRLFGGRK